MIYIYENNVLKESTTNGVTKVKINSKNISSNNLEKIVKNLQKSENSQINIEEVVNKIPTIKTPTIEVKMEQYDPTYLLKKTPELTKAIEEDYKKQKSKTKKKPVKKVKSIKGKKKNAKVR